MSDTFKNCYYSEYSHNVSVGMSFFRCFLLNPGVYTETRNKPVPILVIMMEFKFGVIVSIRCYSKLLLGLNLESPDDLTHHYPTRRLIHNAMYPCQLI